MAAAAILEGSEVPAPFRLERLRKSEKRKTQFGGYEPLR